MKRKVTLYQNYAVTSPIVVGWWNKKIIFPVQDYEERELVTILYHELVHIRQHILEMKKIGIFLKLIFILLFLTILHISVKPYLI